jgi:hypothetical protein
MDRRSHQKVRLSLDIDIDGRVAPTVSFGFFANCDARPGTGAGGQFAISA